MRLVQVRECDGKCCEEKPRWPNADHTDCIYHTLPNGKESGGCKLMTGEEPIPSEKSEAWPERDATETFEATCKDWPQNLTRTRDTGGCCWQWVDDGR